MQKPSTRTIEQIISVAISVAMISTLSTFVQASSANEEQKVKQTGVQQIDAAIEAEMQAHKEKIKALQLEKFSNQRTPFTDEELAQLLSVVGFEGKALKVAWAVVKKESSGRPLAFNGNSRTGDSSYGIFQINMIGGLGVVRRDKYDLKTNTELFNPVVNAEIAYLMTNEGEDWSSWKVGSGYNGTDQKKFLYWYSQFPEGVTL